MIIHIAGTTGSGKSFIGKLLSEMYDEKEIFIIELDEILLPIIRKYNSIKNSKKAHKLMIEQITKELKRVLGLYENIIFVGYEYMILNDTEAETKKMFSFYDIINPQYKFFIRDDVLLSFKRYRARSANYIMNTQVAYYIESYNDWKQIHEEDVAIYDKMGYVALKQPKILRQIILAIGC